MSDESLYFSSLWLYRAKKGEKRMERTAEVSVVSLPFGASKNALQFTSICSSTDAYYALLDSTSFSCLLRYIVRQQIVMSCRVQSEENKNAENEICEGWKRLLGSFAAGMTDLSQKRIICLVLRCGGEANFMLLLIFHLFLVAQLPPQPRRG